MTRVSRFQGTMQKFNREARKATSELKTEIDKNNRDVTPSLRNLHTALNTVQTAQDSLKSRFDQHFKNVKTTIEQNSLSSRESFEQTSKIMKDNFFKMDHKLAAKVDDVYTKQTLLNNGQDAMIGSLRLTTDTLYDLTNTTVSNITNLLYTNKAAITKSVQNIGTTITNGISSNRKTLLDRLQEIAKNLKDDNVAMTNNIDESFGKDLSELMKLQNKVQAHTVELQQHSTILTNLKNNVEYSQQTATQSFGNLGNTVRAVTDKIETSLETKFDAMANGIDTHVQGLMTKAVSIFEGENKFLEKFFFSKKINFNFFYFPPGRPSLQNSLHQILSPPKIQNPHRLQRLLQQRPPQNLPRPNRPQRQNARNERPKLPRQRRHH